MNDLDGLSADDVVAGLRAIGEPTRLRIAALMVVGELSVSELCRILGQSQPRVSRHLKLLGDAGLLQRHSEGTSAYFGPTADPRGRRLLHTVVRLLDDEDGILVADRARLHDVWSDRTRRASDYFDELAESWESMRSRHVADADVETAVVEFVAKHHPLAEDGSPRGRLLDLGTGTGRIMELLADRFEHVVGVDLSANMLNVARGKITESRLANCRVRQGNVYALDVGDELADVAVLHHVLHFLEDPSAALKQTSAAVAPGGLVVVVDFGRHQVDELRTQYGHRWAGFDTEQITRWFDAAELELIDSHHMTVDRPQPEETLSVALWLARRTP